MADGFNYNVSQVVKCDNCGADMFYDPSAGALRCPYCDAVRNVKKSVCYRRDYLSECANGDVETEQEVLKCPNCAGDIPLQSFDTAVKCPYCGATNVVKIEDLKGLKPDSILPFSVSKQGAFEAGKKWIKRKLFAPIKLKRCFSVDNFKGVYIPSYAFSSDTFSQYQGRVGERKTRVVGSGNNRRTETYIEWRNISGTTSEYFEDMAVEASTQLTQKELNKILPYDTDNIEAYNKDYIAGFNAERYDTSLRNGFGIAQGQMDATIRKKILSSYGASIVDYLNVDTQYSNTQFRYMLLPLWVCAYKYRKNSYRFLINGRTGKSTGKSPVSPLKVIIAVLIGLGLIVLVAWLYLNGYFN